MTDERSPQQPTTTDPDFGFTGHLKCPFTGLILAPYRVLGYASWVSRDPLPNAEMLQGPNLCRYVANNPVNLWDPLGFQGFVIGPPGTSPNPAPTSTNDPRITSQGVQNIQNGLQNQANQVVGTFGSIAGVAALAAGAVMAPEVAGWGLSHPAQAAAALTALNKWAKDFGSQPPWFGPVIDLLNGGPGDSWLGPGPFNFNNPDSNGNGVPDYEEDSDGDLIPDYLDECP